MSDSSNEAEGVGLEGEVGGEGCLPTIPNGDLHLQIKQGFTNKTGLVIRGRV